MNTEKESKDNLKALAVELAANYLQASRLDLKRVDGDDKIKDLKDAVLQTPFKEKSYSRNILVIGAGCSYNAYQDIPLAGEAIDKIHKQIIVGHKDYPTFHDLVEKYQKKYAKGSLPDSSDENKDIYLADGIGNRYIDEYRKLKLHSPDYASEDDTIDFETSLNLLAKVIPISQVRTLIKTLYDHRHGPMMFYELVAHLFKHRFIDAIINFNFDEFLDQAIREELGSEGYDQILSDGDCRPITELSTQGRLRQPLYIKPHGTASHKSSMRFTKDQYYELPLDMRVFLSELISCEKEKKDLEGDRYVNLITIGFEMRSLEFNELLNASLPKDSKLFTFYHHDDSKKKTAAEKVRLEKEDHYRVDLAQAFEKGMKTYFIGHEYFKKSKRSTGWNLEDNTPSLGLVFLNLIKQIREFYNSPFQPRRVSRHELLPTIFGGEVFNEAFEASCKTEEYDAIKQEKDSEVKLKEYLATERKRYFKSANYFKDRLIIEIVLALTKNKGRIDLPLLMMGRVGEYYSLYHAAFLNERKEGDKTMPDSILKLIKEVFSNKKKGTKKKKDLTIDRLTISDPIITDDPTHKLEDLFQKFASESEKLLSNPLKRFFKEVLKEPDLKEYLTDKFMNVFKSNRSNIKSILRGTTHHVFGKYSSTNLLNTDLSIDLHFYESLKSHHQIELIQMIAERGNKLASFLDTLMDRPDIHVQLILADPDPAQKNYKDKTRHALRDIYLKHYNQFDESANRKRRLSESEIDERIEKLNITVRFREINRHNHHMVLFLKMNGNGIDWDAPFKINRGIYYFQQGLNESINPIRIIEKENLQSLHKKFEKYWKDSEGL